MAWHERLKAIASMSHVRPGSPAQALFPWFFGPGVDSNCLLHNLAGNLIFLPARP